jgi:hypothetical protein
MAAAKPAGGLFEVHLSQKTGLFYFFLKGESLWFDPALPAGWGWKRASPSAPKTYVNLFTRAEQQGAPVAAALAAGAAAPPPAGAAAAAPARPPPPHAPYAPLNRGVLAAGAGVVALRAAVEAVCAALSAGAYAPPPGCARGLHRFPPLPKHLRAVCHELADEFGLRAESAGEEPDERHVVAWRADAAGPPEAAAAAAEEAALAALAGARAAAERAADVARAAAEGGGAPAGRAAKRKAAGGAGGADQEEDLVVVAPLAPEKLDRRDYREIREEITAKRARLAEEAAARAASAPAAAGKRGGGGGDKEEEEVEEEEKEEEEEIACG